MKELTIEEGLNDRFLETIKKLTKDGRQLMIGAANNPRWIYCSLCYNDPWDGIMPVVVKSNHPRFVKGKRFDYGFMYVALRDGYSIFYNIATESQAKVKKERRELTPKDNEALAKLDGWKKVSYQDLGYTGSHHLKVKQFWRKVGTEHAIETLPDYRVSYDVLIPLLRRQSAKTIEKMGEWLRTKPFVTAMIIHSTELLCEALLRAHNKWKK